MFSTIAKSAGVAPRKQQIYKLSTRRSATRCELVDLLFSQFLSKSALLQDFSPCPSKTVHVPGDIFEISTSGWNGLTHSGRERVLVFQDACMLCFNCWKIVRMCLGGFSEKCQNLDMRHSGTCTHRRQRGLQPPALLKQLPLPDHESCIYYMVKEEMQNATPFDCSIAFFLPPKLPELERSFALNKFV